MDAGWRYYNQSFAHPSRKNGYCRLLEIRSSACVDPPPQDHETWPTSLLIQILVQNQYLTQDIEYIKVGK